VRFDERGKLHTDQAPVLDDRPAMHVVVVDRGRGGKQQSSDGVMKRTRVRELIHRYSNEVSALARFQ